MFVLFMEMSVGRGRFYFVLGILVLGVAGFFVSAAYSDGMFHYSKDIVSDSGVSIDADGDGVVDKAASVPWSGVSGVPSEVTDSPVQAGGDCPDGYSLYEQDSMSKCSSSAGKEGILSNINYYAPVCEYGFRIKDGKMQYYLKGRLDQQRSQMKDCYYAAGGKWVGSWTDMEDGIDKTINCNIGTVGTQLWSTYSDCTMTIGIDNIVVSGNLNRYTPASESFYW